MPLGDFMKLTYWLTILFSVLFSTLSYGPVDFLEGSIEEETNARQAMYARVQVECSARFIHLDAVGVGTIREWQANAKVPMHDVWANHFSHALRAACEHQRPTGVSDEISRSQANSNILVMVDFSSAHSDVHFYRERIPVLPYKTAEQARPLTTVPPLVIAASPTPYISAMNPAERIGN